MYKFIKLTVHPYIYAFLTKGLFSIRWKWYKKFKRRIKIQALSSHHFLEYHFYNKEDDEIKI